MDLNNRNQLRKDAIRLLRAGQAVLDEHPHINAESALNAAIIQELRTIDPEAHAFGDGSELQDTVVLAGEVAKSALLRAEHPDERQQLQFAIDHTEQDRGRAH